MEESAIEQFQRETREYSDYQGYCRKIANGIENLDKKSGERAIWELIQNARDMSEEARIKISLNDSSLVFSHHGKPFDYMSLRSLVKQDSSKDGNNADLAGQYGTGFMTTHAFSRTVYISGTYEVKNSETTVGKVAIKDFKLDRTKVDTTEGPHEMQMQLNQVEDLYKQIGNPANLDDTTSFRYDLSSDQIRVISRQLYSTVIMMPFVLVINGRIKEIEVSDEHSGQHCTLSRGPKNEEAIETIPGWKKITDVIHIDNGQGRDECVCISLQSDKGDVIILPPYPDGCKPESIPSLFLWFPLLGTENFGVNFIFHSKRFYPVEKRNNIQLPEDCSDEKKKQKGKINRDILVEMMNALFKYYGQEFNAKTLTLETSCVAFPQTSEDEETRAFYEEMQKLWNVQIPDWKIIPVEEEFYSVSDPSVKLLRPEFYKNLTEEQKVQFEPTIIKYLRLITPKLLFPTKDLIRWSETVNGWRCGKDDVFFITVGEVCESIKNNSEDLYKFLELMQASGNENVMEKYALLPNREGNLRKKSELRNAGFMNDEVYSLVKTLMGKDAEDILDPNFRDICTVGEYKTDDLKKSISEIMKSWRRTLGADKDDFPMLKENNGNLSALITFCSAFHIENPNNSRSRMMPMIARYFNKEYHPVITIRFTEQTQDEENFYSSAYNLLLDYTLFCVNEIGQIGNEENVENAENTDNAGKVDKEWLLDFLNAYGADTNAERAKRLDEYAVLPNRNGNLCFMHKLHKNEGVTEEMAELYISVIGADLNDIWIDPDFEGLIELDTDNPKDIAKQIEETLVEDMKNEKENRKYEKQVRDIILKIGGAQNKDWEIWFSQINEKKATYVFSMKEGPAQESLFHIMDIDDGNLKRLADITKEAKGQIGSILDKIERQQQLEQYERYRFDYLHKIGKHIEDTLRNYIGDEVKVEMSSNSGELSSTDDIQNGQDIIVSVKSSEGWKPIYYVEVKSKWDFEEPAHMSTNQIKRAVQNPDNYALCCVDLRDHKNELETISKETILDCTKVKMDIGHQLEEMMGGILAADERTDDNQIKISGYLSNMSAKVFETGETIDTLLKKIEETVDDAINLT